jgi:hypothetical protein
MPEMFAQTMAFGIGGTMAAVSADVEKGITDRFRAMPMSATVTATRELFGNPVAAGDSWPAQHALALAVAWPIGLVAVFLPLAARRYDSLST